VPQSFVLGVPAHVDGRMIEISQKAGASVINSDRMWHYTEGLTNWNPIWPKHGIRVIPGPSSLWLDATGKRLPPFLYPGCDTLATLRHICSTGYDYTWFVLNKSIIAREFALSGSEQNPDITGKSILLLLQRIFGSNGTGPVQAFMKNGEDFIVETSLDELLERMDNLGQKHGGPPTKDAQLMLIQNARNFWPDKFSRVVKPHKLLDPSYGPLIAVRMNLLTRKTLGGLETDLSANVLHQDGTRFTNLYAAGEVAGFGGGGVHGYNSLEGTFLGGCIFSGRTAGIAMAEKLAKAPTTQSS
jgi:predicted oxidoreductase